MTATLDVKSITTGDTVTFVETKWGRKEGAEHSGIAKRTGNEWIEVDDWVVWSGDERGVNPACTITSVTPGAAHKYGNSRNALLQEIVSDIEQRAIHLGPGYEVQKRAIRDAADAVREQFWTPLNNKI